MGHTVLNVSSRALLTACERMGVDTDKILASAGLTREAIEDPDGRIPLPSMGAMWHKAYELSKDPDLVLHAVEALPFGAYKVIDFLAWNAPTIGEALCKVSQYFPLIHTAARLPIEVGDNVVTFGVGCPEAPAAATRPWIEYTLAAIFLRTRTATGVDYPLRQVEIAHPAPERTSEQERIFGCPVRYGTPASCMTLDRVVWDLPVTRADHSLFKVLDEHAQLLLERLPKSTGEVGRVRAAIGAELRGGDPSLEHVAKGLGMSPRTVQRRLKEEGTSYNDLLDEMRGETAKTYLGQRDVALSEVAYLLGFAEQSSFSRAFKRWTGQSPGEYRAALDR